MGQFSVNISAQSGSILGARQHFDLTFSTGMGGEHTTAINGQGQPGLEHVLAIGSKHRIANAVRIVEEVRHAVAQWPALAEKWAVTRSSAIEIEEALAKVASRF